MNKVYLAGENGLLGSAIKTRLEHKSIKHVSTTSKILDLRNSSDVNDFFAKERPTHTILSAAKTGGIFSNQKSPLLFIKDNLRMQSNVFEAAQKFGCKTVSFIASSTIYPETATQPYQEFSLFGGKLHPSIASYGYAKLMGIHEVAVYNQHFKTDYRCLIPCNMYGPGDKYDGENKHVIPALVDKIYEAKKLDLGCISLNGTGTAKREFIYSHDVAEFLVDVNLQLDQVQWLNLCDPDNFCINIGVEEEVSISGLAHLISQIIGYKGQIKFDLDENDGAARKKVSLGRLKRTGWKAKTTLLTGLRQTILERIEKV